MSFLGLYHPFGKLPYTYPRFRLCRLWAYTIHSINYRIPTYVLDYVFLGPIPSFYTLLYTYLRFRLCSFWAYTFRSLYYRISTRVSDCGFVPVRGWICTPTTRLAPLCIIKDHVLMGHVISSTHALSTVQCARLCLTTPACLSAQFSKDGYACQLNSQTTDTTLTLISAPGWHFISSNLC